MDEQNIFDDKIDTLLLEFDEHRAAIKIMIDDLEKIKEHVDKLFPESLDKRYMRFFEEKVKSVTGLFNSLLDMRKEIAKSIKDEIELRRKIQSKSPLENLEELFDVRQMANKVKDFQDKALKLKQSEGNK